MQDKQQTQYSDRITYRPFSKVPEDILFEDMRKMLTNPKNVEFFWDGKPWSSEQISNFMHHSIQHWENFEFFGTFASYETNSGKFMGYMELTYEENPYPTHTKTVELGYIIDSAFQGNRYGVEIAHFGYQYMEANVARYSDTSEHLPEKMIAFVDPANTRSIKILQSLLGEKDASIYRIPEFGNRERWLFFKSFNQASKANEKNLAETALPDSHSMSSK